MYNRRIRKYCCMNNNQIEHCEKEKLEDACQNECCSMPDYGENCNCGFDEDTSGFPENPMLGQSYVPIQYMDKTFRPDVGLKMGTIYPELVSPYCPGQSMQEIAYLRKTNKIGEGCNACQ